MIPADEEPPLPTDVIILPRTHINLSTHKTSTTQFTLIPDNSMTKYCKRCNDACHTSAYRANPSSTVFSVLGIRTLLNDDLSRVQNRWVYLRVLFWCHGSTYASYISCQSFLLFLRFYVYCSIFFRSLSSQITPLY